MSEANPFNKPEACEVCPLFLEPGPVLGSGNRNAKIIYLGEAPGAEEVDAPRHRPDHFAPFIGGTGRVRNALLRHAGIEKNLHLYTTNTVKCRPPGNRLPTEFETQCCVRFLVEEIEDVQPNLIIAAGELALNTLTGKKKIGLWRGVVTEGPTLGRDAPYKVFPIWHPSFVMRQQYNWPFAVLDLVRAKDEGAFPEIRRLPFSVERRADLNATRADLLRAGRERGYITFDFETTGLDFVNSAIRMCGFVGRSDQANVYDWTIGTQQLFQEVLDDPAIKIVGQNILNFDLPFAEEKAFRIPWLKVFDTMVAFHLCNSSYGQTTVAEQNKGTFRQQGAEKDLAMIASCHTDIEYWKSKDAYRNDIYGVCGVDCIATDRAALDPKRGLVRELELYGMTDLYWKHVLPVHPVLKKMTRLGVKLDESRAAAWSMLLEREADEREAALRAGLGDPFLNLHSPKQLMDLLYKKLGLPVQYKDDKKRGRVATADAEAMENLARLAPENVILRSINDVRHLRKMKSTYVDLALLGDGRAHPKFGVSKAANGRFNSWDPNGQNVPEAMRDMWIPDSDEHVLISADSSQIEWRVAMVLSGDPVGLELLASGVDNHRAVAAETLGIRIEDVTDEQRHAAKFIVYGLGYGRGPDSIAKGHGLDFNFVVSFIQRFFRRFTVFGAWRERQVDIVKDQYFLANPWMRRRWWYSRQVTEVYNFPASSCAADMMIDELIALDAALPAAATLRLTVHDEVVVCSPKDLARDVVGIVRSIMQQPVPRLVEASADPATVRRFYPDGWFCPADVHVGTNWKMCKSKDPEDKAARASLERSLGL